MAKLAMAFAVSFMLAMNLSSAQMNLKIESFNYVFDLTKKLIELEQKGSDIILDEFQEISSISCTVFTELIRDDDFKRLLIYFSKNQHLSGINKEVKLVYRKFEAFLDLLKIEMRFLLNAGFSENEASHILGNMFTLRVKLKSFELRPEDVMVALRQAAKDACEIKKRIKDTIERREMVNAVSSWAMVLGGAAIMAIDAPATPFWIGLASIVGAQALIVQGSRGLK